MDKRVKVLLTGASGTVGFEVLKQLYQKRDHYEISLFDLPTKKARKMFSPYTKGIDIQYGDISNENDIRKVCSDKDYIIHLAAIIPPLADDNPELAHKVNFEGTKNLVSAVEESSPSAFFIYSSSISVYGDRLKEPGIKVGDPLMASEGDEYAKTKIAAEEVIQNSKLDWTIFRLTAIMGNHSDTKLMFHMPLKSAMEIATPEDTGRAFVNALEKQSALAGKIFNLGGGKRCRLSYEDFLSRSFQIFGLGELDFPPKAFAEKNFHCGDYIDGDELDKIVQFRRQDIDDYFSMVKNSSSSFTRMISSLFKKQIKKGMLKKSEPYHAFKTNDTLKINRYF
jgi:cholest-5-ene-3beta,7alpha-diol 3beta-dehydrogenase